MFLCFLCFLISKPCICPGSGRWRRRRTAQERAGKASPSHQHRKWLQNPQPAGHAVDHVLPLVKDGKARVQRVLSSAPPLHPTRRPWRPSHPLHGGRDKGQLIGDGILRHRPAAADRAPALEVPTGASAVVSTSQNCSYFEVGLFYGDLWSKRVFLSAIGR